MHHWTFRVRVMTNLLFIFHLCFDFGGLIAVKFKRLKFHLFLESKPTISKIFLNWRFCTGFKFQKVPTFSQKFRRSKQRITIRVTGKRYSRIFRMQQISLLKITDNIRFINLVFKCLLSIRILSLNITFHIFWRIGKSRVTIQRIKEITTR